MFVPNVSAVEPPFPDMAGSFYRYREAVSYLVERGIITGYPDGSFKPKNTINRAELLTVILRGKTEVEPLQRRCFSDVNPEAWFAPYVCTAKNRGIVDGYSNGTFKPEQTVNFAEAIKIILNANGEKVVESPGANWYLPYAQKLEEMQILPEHAYVPWTPLNRERAADLLWRITKNKEERFIPRLSPGCGKAPPVLSPTTVIVYDKTRQFLLTIPSGYNLHDPIPLTVAFHGRTNSNDDVRKYMRLDRELKDSIIAYPAALSNGNGTFSWANPGDKAQSIRDIAFFDAIVQTLSENYCIDMDRISTVGHSLGAWMANTVACVRGDVVLASATVGGDSVFTDCAGPAAAMIVHNPKDNLSPFSGAEKLRQQRVEDNACSWDTVATGPAELNCVRHSNCAGGNDILWCPSTIDTDERGAYYPHTWPRQTAQFIQDFFKSIR